MASSIKDFYIFKLQVDILTEQHEIPEKYF